jgi:hypothetical protein
VESKGSQVQTYPGNINEFNYDISSSPNLLLEKIERILYIKNWICDFHLQFISACYTSRVS